MLCMYQNKVNVKNSCVALLYVILIVLLTLFLGNRKLQ